MTGQECCCRPRLVFIAFKEGVIWNFTHELETVKDWLDRGVIECFAPFEPTDDLTFSERD